MTRHFFLDKVNTIRKNSYVNNGLNPIMELNYGLNISRGILHFDESEILSLVEDKTFADLSKLTCSLKMTNCMSVDGLYYEKEIDNDNLKKSKRACSIDVVAFKLPQKFDRGRGYDSMNDFWVKESSSYSNHGASWYFAYDGKVWAVDEDKIDLRNPDLNIDTECGRIWVLSATSEGEVVRVKIELEGGVYSDEYLQSEYDKYIGISTGTSEIIIGVQHFDFGNENLNIDITDYVKKIINGEENFGIGLMFVLPNESWETEKQQYMGFFNNNTNTFFHPYIECKYDYPIKDDRSNFCIGRTNRLYLYVDIDGEPINLDNIPVCTINDIKYEVIQSQKGVYYAEIEAKKDEWIPNTIQYDIWSNLAYNGQEIEDIEQEFEVHKSNLNFNGVIEEGKITPNISGINCNGDIHRGEKIRIDVDFRKQYTTDKKDLIEGAKYRIYVKDGGRELTVFDYDNIEKRFLNNYFYINTSDMIPNKYFVDIQATYKNEVKIFKNVLNFNVVSDITKRYE